MSKLVELLAGELERPRELSDRVVNYISGHYSVDHDAIGDFLVAEISKLADDEVDLILSPAFTPKLGDQAVFAELLGVDPAPQEQWPSLVQQLVERPTRAQLITADGQRHAVQLREVTIERYVYRLRLDGSIPEPVFELISRLPSADRPMLKAIARRAVWAPIRTREILDRFFRRTLDAGTYSLGDSLDLLNLVEGRKPADIDELISRIPTWREALKQQIDAGGGSRPFFSEDVRLMHGGDRDQRQQDDVRMSAKEREFEFLGRLSRTL